MKNEIENIFKEKFDSFESAPSAGLFDALQAKRAKKKKRAIWLWSAAAIGFLGMSYAVFCTLTSETADLNSTPIVEIDKSHSGLNIVQEQLPLADESIINEENIKKKEVLEINNERKTTTSRPYVNTKSSNKLESKPIVSMSPKLVSSNDAQRRKSEYADLYDKLVKNATNDKGQGQLYVRDKLVGNSPDIQKVGLRERKNKELQSSELRNTDKPNIYDKTNDVQAIVNTNEEEDVLTDDNDNNNVPLPIRKLVKLSSWSMELTAGPGHVHSMFNGENINVDNAELGENARVSYLANLNTVYQISSAWNLIAGIQYQKENKTFKYEIAESKQYFDRQETRTETIIHPVLGEITREFTVTVKDSTITSGSSIKTNNNYTTIQIPIGIERNFILNEKWSILSQGSANFTVFTDAYGTGFDGEQFTSISSNDYNNIGLVSLGAGLGARYRVNDRFALIAYPKANFSLNNIQKSSSLKERNIGIFTSFGLRINL